MTAVSDIDEWLRVRDYFQRHRHELSASAAARYPAAHWAEGIPLLTTPSWLPAAPLPLASVRLDWTGPGQPGPGRGGPGAAAWAAALAALLPRRADGSRYRRYSEAIADLAPPAIWEDRRTYRLAGADLAGPRPSLAFAPGTFFQGVDVGGALGHEHAAAVMGALPREDLRALVGAPWELARRPATVAVATLTLRAAGDGATFPLHWREPGRVGHAGGMYQVVPAGIFQGVDDGPASQAHDFDLWRCMTREFAEELLGASEDYGPAGTLVDYGAWPFARRLDAARADGSLRAWVLGLGIDPLTLATDLLTAVVIDAPVFDELFGAMVDRNAEGRVLRDQPFTAGVVDRLTTREPTQAAGAALLRLAWRHRGVLLGPAAVPG
jgi:hypothetical protein